jgi:hypothetical protein
VGVGNLGAALLHKYFNISWWEWTKGSYLFFVRWNGSTQQPFAREGMPMYVSSALGVITITQHHPKPSKFELFTAKLQRAIERGYFEEGDMWSLIDVFDVPKGLDIHAVYNCVLLSLFCVPHIHTVLNEMTSHGEDRRSYVFVGGLLSGR